MAATPQWIWQQPNWPHFTWADRRLGALLRTVHRQQGQLLGSLHATDEANDQATNHGSDHRDHLRSEMDALLRNALNTSAIEGEQLDTDTVRSSLARRLGLERAGLPPGTAQTDGLADVLLDATRNHHSPLTMDRLYQWHRALFPDGPGLLTSMRVGELRGGEPMQVVSGPIGKYTLHFEAPARDGLEAELDAFLAWFDRSRQDAALDPLLRAGLAHLWFVTLHPFDDGNGRLARAIADLALAQADHHSIRFYAMAAAIMARRQDYYRILEATQRGGLNITEWLEWFLITLGQAMDSALGQVRQVLLKTRFWRRHAQTILSDRQIKVINRLLDAGPNGFEGGLNARKYRGLTSVSKATATRDLGDLLEKGVLCQLSGCGRSSGYAIDWPTGRNPTSWSRGTRPRGLRSSGKS